MREEGEALKDKGDVALVRRDPLHRLPADDDLARVQLVESGDHAHGRRLAAPAGSDDRDELARLDGKIHIVDSHDVAKRLVALRSSTS